jgi:hypothetical protein
MEDQYDEQGRPGNTDQHRHHEKLPVLPSQQISQPKFVRVFRTGCTDERYWDRHAAKWAADDLAGMDSFGFEVGMTVRAEEN